MRRGACPLSAILLSAALLTPAAPSTAAAPAVPAPAPLPFDDGAEDDCLQAVPHTVGVQGVTDAGQTIDLHVLVLLDVNEGSLIAELAKDETTAVEAEARFRRLVDDTHPQLAPMASTYTPLGISVRFSYDLLDPLNADGTPRDRSATTGEDLIALAKQQHRWTPPGVDVIYVITDSPHPTAAGKADCIGGIRYRDRAFAFGKYLGPGYKLGPVGLWVNDTAKVAAHEIGHLLGAQHLYANCAEGIVSEPLDDAASACTLMINDIGLASLNTSAVNSAVIRGHAVAYADD